MACYIDNIFIFSKNMEAHEWHRCLVFNKLKEVWLYAKLEKWNFHKIKVEFLGYIIFRKGICMDPCKVQTIENWVIPYSIHDVYYFFGFANFNQCFITHYFMIMAHLTCLTWKDQPFI